MDKYTELKGKINEVINGEWVYESENVISLNDLHFIVGKRMAGLRDVMKSQEFMDKVNADRTIMERIGFRKRAVVSKKCSIVMPQSDGEVSRIAFGFDKDSKNYSSNFVIILKERESDELYFESYSFIDEEFVKKYMSEIYGMFATIEEYASMFPQGVGFDSRKPRNAIVQTFDYGILRVTIECSVEGSVTAFVSLVDGVDSDKVYDRKWVNRETLSDYVKAHIVDILGRIPVEIPKLNPEFQAIVLEYKSKMEAKRLERSFYFEMG